MPTSRYGSAGAYVELEDFFTYLDKAAGVKLRRKYLYIYGGFSFDCTTACNDTWRYQISYAPLSYYPQSRDDVSIGKFSISIKLFTNCYISLL